MYDQNLLEKYDHSGMHKIYDEWPEIAEKSYNMNYEPIDFSDIDNIVFAGMGGSGTIGDAFSSILSKTNIHVSITKGYHLPKTVDSHTLVIATSISGNTVETLSLLQSTKNYRCKVIGFSNGGKIEEFCNDNKIEFRSIPYFHSPRSSFPSFLYSMLHVLEPIIRIRKDQANESIRILKNLGKQIYSTNLTENNPALSLAESISGIPLIYYPWGLHSVAIRFKNSLQENSKQHAMIEDVIEACHNGIVAWEKKSIMQPILIQGADDHVKTKERWKIIKQYFNENNISYVEVNSIEGNILSKIMYLVYLLDYSTIYLAVLSKIDPSPIRSIDYIKNKIINS